MQVTTVVPLRVIFFVCLGGIFFVLAKIMSFAMTAKVNERASENDRISYFGWGANARSRFKQFYPESRLLILHDGCLVLMVVCLAVLVRLWVFASPRIITP